MQDENDNEDHAILKQDELNTVYLLMGFSVYNCQSIHIWLKSTVAAEDGAKDNNHSDAYRKNSEGKDTTHV